jgi:hypothetical protein
MQTIIRKFINQTDKLNRNQLEALVLSTTGMRFGFAVASSRIWGKEGEEEYGEFFQLMPDDIQGMNFFYWYCVEREYMQFFKTREECVVNFLFYWTLWNQSIKGKP